MKNVIKMCASSEMFQVSLTVSGVFAASSFFYLKAMAAKHRRTLCYSGERSAMKLNIHVNVTKH